MTLIVARFASVALARPRLMMLFVALAAAVIFLAVGATHAYAACDPNAGVGC